MAAGMSPEDIEELLRELASRLSARGVTATIRLVGGAALAARSYRTSATFDVDAVFHPEGRYSTWQLRLPPNATCRPTG